MRAICPECHESKKIVPPYTHCWECLQGCAAQRMTLSERMNVPINSPYSGHIPCGTCIPCRGQQESRERVKAFNAATRAGANPNR